MLKPVFLAAFLIGASPQRPVPLPPPVPPLPPANCTAPEYHQLDFLIGNWDVFIHDRPNTMVGGYSFSSPGLAFGCWLHEYWSPFTLITGESLISFDKRKQVWRRTWVDAAGHRVDFEGHVENGLVVFTGQWPDEGRTGTDVLLRESFWKEGDNIRHVGEDSRDNGDNWTEIFDFTYWPATHYRPQDEGTGEKQ